MSNEFVSSAASAGPAERDTALALDVERLLRFGRKHKLVKELDVIVARNTLLDILGLAAPYEGKVPKESFDTPTEILEHMLDLAAQKGLFDNTVPQYRINFETRLMGALMPRESEVCKKFRKLCAQKGPQAATDWFTTCAWCPTTSAPLRSPATSSGPPPPPTASWRSPST